MKAKYYGITVKGNYLQELVRLDDDYTFRLSWEFDVLNNRSIPGRYVLNSSEAVKIAGRAAVRRADMRPGESITEF